MNKMSCGGTILRAVVLIFRSDDYSEGAVFWALEDMGRPMMVLGAAVATSERHRPRCILQGGT